MKLPARLPALALAALAFTAVAARADDLVTIDWNTSQGSLKSIVGLNAWSGIDPAVAGDSSYRASVSSINPTMLRLHAKEMLHPSTEPKSWLNPDGLTWNASRIRSVLDSLSPVGPALIVNIPKWPAALAPTGAKLPEDKKAAFATFCADLADILKAYPRVTHLEILNEVDNLYNGSADLTELMNLCIQVRTAVRARTTAISLIPAPWTQPWDPEILTFIDLMNKDLFQTFSYHNYSTSGSSTDLNLIFNNAEGIGPRASTLRNRLNARPNGGAIKLFIGEHNTYSEWQNDSQGWMRQEEGAVSVALAWRGCMQSRVGGIISTDNLQIWNDADGTYGVLNPWSAYALRPTGRLLKELRARFSAGTERRTTSSTSSIRPFVALNGTQRSLLLINRDLSLVRTVDLAFVGTGPSVNGSATLIRIEDGGVQQTTISYVAGQPPQNLLLQPRSVAFLYFP